MHKKTYFLLFGLLLANVLNYAQFNQETNSNYTFNSKNVIRHEFKWLYYELEDYLESDSVRNIKPQLLEASALVSTNTSPLEAFQVYFNLALIYLEEGDFMISSQYCKRALVYAYQLDNQLYLVKVLNTYASNYLNQSRLDSARFSLDEAMEIARKNKYEDYITLILNNIAFIEFTVGNREEALSVYLKVLDIYTAQDKMYEKAVLLNNLGEALQSAGNYEKANEYYLQAIQIFSEIDNKHGIVMSKLNLSTSYLEKDLFAEAHDLLTETGSLATLIQDTVQLAILYHNMGRYYLETGEFNAVNMYLDSSMQLCLHQSFESGRMKNLTAKGILFMRQKKYQDAISYFENAAKLAERIKKWKDKIEIVNLLYKSYEGIGDYSRAIHFLELSYHLRDSILLDSRNKNVMYMQNKFEQEKRQSDIAHLNHAILEKDDYLRKIVIAILLIFIGLSSVAYFFILKRRSSQNDTLRMNIENEELKVDLEFKNRELVRNALYIANSYEQTVSFIKKLDELYPLAEETLKDTLSQFQAEVSKFIPMQAWKEFENRFEQVHAGFFQNLTTRYPGLTPIEVRICSLLRLNLNTKEIAVLMNRTTGTIDNARSNIRKKLRLNEDENLTTLLMSM